ncbi:MAG: hypothetical protein HYV08_12400 [Deltaproteobacteria bacterium]|nr:hypothetical protein [Deltaproteobacteria bacterium]MBI3076206.1 hypothetical protein [Deltaproteobacteria bacterium]
MARASLVRDAQSNLVAAASRLNEGRREYEFTFPLRNRDPGDTDWARGQAYQLAVLVGPTAEYHGMSEQVWMSDQFIVRLGSGATESIFRAPISLRLEPEETSGGAAPHRH